MWLLQFWDYDLRLSQYHAYGTRGNLLVPAVSLIGSWRVSNPRQIHEIDLPACSTAIGYNFWTIGRKAFSSLKWSARGGRSLGADLVIEYYAKIQYMPPRIIDEVGFPGPLLRSGELWSADRVDGDRYTKHDRYAHLYP